MKKLIFSLIISLAVTTNLVAQSDLQVIAEVNISKREPITLGELKEIVTLTEKQEGVKLSVEQRRQMFDALILQKLTYQAVQKEGIKVTDSQLQQEFESRISQMVSAQITEAEFANLIKKEFGMTLDQYFRKETGSSLADYKDALRNQLSVLLYVTTKNQSKFEKLTVSESDIKNVYEVNKQNFVRPDSIKINLVAVEKKGKISSETSKAEALRKRLVDNPKNLAQIQKEAQEKNAGFIVREIILYKNEDVARALGITMNQLLELFALKVNDVTNVKEMDDNVQFIHITAKYDMKFLTLNDEIDYGGGNTTTVRETIKSQLLYLAYEAALQEAVNEFGQSLKTSANYKLLKTDSELSKLLAW